MKPHRYTSDNWLGKVSAAVFLGFFMSVGLSGLATYFLSGNVARFSLEHQLSMWAVAPILITILSACFMFRSGKQAWLWLAFSNIVIWGSLFAL